jgi:hypothetical protein
MDNMNLIGKRVKIINCDWAPWNGHGQGLQGQRPVPHRRRRHHRKAEVIAGEILWLFPNELEIV